MFRIQVKSDELHGARPAGGITMSNGGGKTGMVMARGGHLII
jgi:hypothetical protein